MLIVFETMYSFLLLFFLLVAATNATPLSPVSVSNNVKEASIKDFPFHVMILFYHSEHERPLEECGGSIITENWIVTSCVILKPIEKYKIRAGSDLRRGKSGSLHQVTKIYESPGSNEGLALMHVREPFIFDETRQPISLFKTGETLTPGAMANVTGFPTQISGVRPEHLQSIEVPIIDAELCSKGRESIGGVPKGQVCAGYRGRDACFFALGDPLVVGRRLAGISSLAFGCGSETYYPKLYHEVAHYYEWIDIFIELE